MFRVYFKGGTLAWHTKDPPLVKQQQQNMGEDERNSPGLPADIDDYTLNSP